VSRVLDDLVEVPGTGRRFGIDPLLGFVPVVGDLASAIVGLWLIAEATRFRLPRVVLARMVVNTLVDLVVGAIPLIGDAFDFVAKPNARNLALFRRYAGDPASSTSGQRLFFVGLGLLLVGLGWLLGQALGWLQSIELSVPGL
jgi:hypothetical protein